MIRGDEVMASSGIGAGRESFRQHWARGFQITVFFGLVVSFAFIAGGLVTSLVYGICVVLPAEAFFHDYRLEDYWVEVFILGAVVFGFGFVGQAKGSLLKMIGELK
jgi:hypothetical protein